MFPTKGEDESHPGHARSAASASRKRTFGPWAARRWRAFGQPLDGDEVVDVQRVDKRYVLTISEKGYSKLTDQSEYTCQTRGGKGRQDARSPKRPALWRD